MLVDLAGVTLDVPGFGRAGGDFEVLAGHDGIGRVGCACPLLAVGAVAEGWEGLDIQKALSMGVWGG